MTLAITIGRGRRNPRGRLVRLADEVPAARALMVALESQTASEAWWSQHTWKNNHRAQAGWLAAAGVGVDMDYLDANGDHVAPAADLAAAVLQAARDGKLPGSIFHLTPRGFRVIFSFGEPVADRKVFAAAARGAGALVAAAARAERLIGYQVDEPALLDTARFLYAPRALVDEVQRDAEVLLLREEPYAPAALAPAPARPLLVPSVDFKEAARRYAMEHAREWPRHSATCPMCGHNECFGRLPTDPSRWACFSSNHQAPGVNGPGCTHGDVLDLDAHAAGSTPAELLRREGYLSPRQVDDEVLVRQQQKPLQQAIPGTVQSIESAKLKGLSKSYASLCAILRNDRRIIPEPLEWNEMLAGPTLGGDAFEEHSVGELREKIELIVTDRNGKPLQFKPTDIELAVKHVANERKYHPVREYLERLEWDETPRIEAVAEDILGVERTALGQAMLRKWFVSAAARPLDPGCKVDNVLILTGPQGPGKSAFFRTLAGDEWFSDTLIDIGNREALASLRHVWIYEWAELVAMRRAHSSNAVKAFITSQRDRFRPAWARKEVDAKRHSIIVGTTNDSDFLSDPTGNRRFWPLRCGPEVNTQLLSEWRDQLWAEAAAAFRAGEKWWLAKDEEAVLVEEQKQYEVRDVFEDKLETWIASRTAPPTMGEVLKEVFEKREQDWLRADEMRAGNLLRRLGYTHRRGLVGGVRAWRWFKEVG